jgi:hypothetical protein
VTQTLGKLTASTTRLALVGLAKNTGKTEALAALLRELEAQGRRVGVTSVGRDGEQRDVIDARIAKPRIVLPGGSLVASTDALLSASGLPHELLERTGIRTPLGEVLIARLRGPGAIEVAGPSAAADVRAVSDAMLAQGAEQILIDGAIDRRAASSPEVSDGLIMATGAVLDRDLAEVVRLTRDAVELVRLPLAASDELPSELPTSVALPAGFTLSSSVEQIAQLLDDHASAEAMVVAGALPDSFLRGLLQPLRQRRRKLVLIVSDPTKVFLSGHAPAWYRRQGVEIRVLRPIELRAITVNPVAPQSHRFDSARLRGMLQAAIANLPIFDVLDPSYTSVRRGSSVPARVDISLGR